MPQFSFVRRLFAAFLAMLLTMPAAQAAGLPQQPDTSSPQPQSTQSASALQDDSSMPNAPAPQQEQQSTSSSSSQQAPEPQQNNTTPPLGTAAAPSEQPVGVAGSRPAGAAIAPAKQRRVRRIFISVGILIAAGVAVGTVAALSRSSPSTPR